MPVDLKPRVLSTSITLDDSSASLALGLDVAEYFRLSLARARTIASEVGAAVARWKSVAARFGLSVAERDRMASAFEHEDLAAARRGLKA